MALYQVQRNDTPGTIAKKFTGDPRQMHALVLANPHKPWALQNGTMTFKQLHAGEQLTLPNGWDGVNYGEQGMMGVGRTGVGDTVAGASGAAITLQNYLTSNGCDCSVQQCVLTKAFQIAYNADVASGLYSGPAIGVDAKFGTQGAAAYQQVMGAAPPAVCFSAGGPCFGNATADANAATAMGSSPTPPQPQPQPQPLPQPQPQPAPGPNQQTIVNPPATDMTPWIIGAVAVAAGVGLVMYYRKQQHGGSGGGVHHALPAAHHHARRSNPIREGNDDLWIFNWKGGGYNSVRAKTRAEALAKGNAFGKPSGGMKVTLKVDPKTLHRGTWEELRHLDSAYS